VLRRTVFGFTVFRRTVLWAGVLGSTGVVRGRDDADLALLGGGSCEAG
jgi:hypothetical protein